MNSHETHMDKTPNPKKDLKKFERLPSKKKKGMLLNKEAERTIGKSRADLENKIETTEEQIRE